MLQAKDSKKTVQRQQGPASDLQAFMVLSSRHAACVTVTPAPLISSDSAAYLAIALSEKYQLFPAQLHRHRLPLLDLLADSSCIPAAGPEVVEAHGWHKTEVISKMVNSVSQQQRQCMTKLGKGSCLGKVQSPGRTPPG